MFEGFATVAHVMKGQDAFAAMLAGGHPNSLGRTVEVVELVLAAQPRLRELFDCYTSADDVVRLRTSNAVKRVSAEQPSWLLPSLETLAEWARTDSKLASWLRPHLDRLSKDPRKSVASRAAKKQKLLFGKSSS